MNSVASLFKAILQDLQGNIYKSSNNNDLDYGNELDFLEKMTILI